MSDLSQLDILHRRLLWLSSWSVHNANHLRQKVDGTEGRRTPGLLRFPVGDPDLPLFHALRPEDRVAVKPHASPAFHAIQYLMGNLPREKLEALPWL